MSDLVAGFERRIRALDTGSRTPLTWFLDIDGVVNVIGGTPHPEWPRYDNTHVVFDSLAMPICWAPDLVNLMNLMHKLQVISFRWLTTWEHEGPRAFAPAVGLNIGTWVAADSLNRGMTWWKLDAIVDHLAESDQMFIWTDDHISRHHHARQVIDMLTPGRAFTLCPDGREGITPQDFNLILTAIEQTR